MISKGGSKRGPDPFFADPQNYEKTTRVWVLNILWRPMDSLYKKFDFSYTIFLQARRIRRQESAPPFYCTCGPQSKWGGPTFLHNSQIHLWFYTSFCNNIVLIYFPGKFTFQTYFTSDLHLINQLSYEITFCMDGQKSMENLFYSNHVLK